jgi:histidinol-phosphate aminotransferase
MNRRLLLKQLGAGLTFIGAGQLRTFATPVSNHSIQAGNQPVRLSSNENPYGPAPVAMAAMAESIAGSNRYNWNTASDLIAAIARKNNVADDNILIGPGSTEILDLTFRLPEHQGGSFIIASPSYNSWTKTAEASGLRKIAVPLTGDKRHDLPAMLAAIQPDTRFVYVCNPNNPTGTICDHESLATFINEATKRVTVIADEAYLDFTAQRSVSRLAGDNKNLIIVKTFSKIYGLAGARTGYAISHKDTIDKLSRLQTWPNGGISVVSRAGAIASLKADDFVNQCYVKNEAARKYTIEQLTRLNITCVPSHTNFIYFSLANYSKDYFALLKSNNIQGTNIYEEDGRWTRITVGSMQEMQQFVAAIK